MVQNQSPKRGRPREYDPDVALARAMAVFWDAGFAGTSLDELALGTRMNRPSLYAAFGDKRNLYMRALERYRSIGRDAMAEALSYDKPLRDALGGVYHRALSLYFSGERSARGCFLIGTALTEAALDIRIRDALREALLEIDAAFQARIRFAIKHDELPPHTDAHALAKFASAVLHTLAIRSRAGESRRTLAAMIAPALDMICGLPRPPVRS